MSSEISIEAPPAALQAEREPGLTAPPAPGRTPAGADLARPDQEKADEGFQPWHFFVLASILLATVSVMLARQSSPESLILISLTIAAAGFAAAAFYRMLAPLTQPFVLRMGEPVSERTRGALEREKMLVLRTIKELEFDRAMGKLSQKDFDEMAGRLRSRALSLMRQLDLESGTYTSVIEQELAGRLESNAGRLKPDAGRLKPASTAPDAGRGRLQSAHAAARACACGTGNDVDAVFCKKCGARLS
ncbi:MAG TPA: hypothetical protein VM364_02145 [Vicinamibacterales bacterium]|nr:hypothetical protein [Vicinamibacterales bacterium]